MIIYFYRFFFFFFFVRKNIHNSSDTTNTSQIDNANKSIIRKLHEENLFMAHQLKKMTDERNTSQNKVLNL